MSHADIILLLVGAFLVISGVAAGSWGRLGQAIGGQVVVVK